LIYAKATKLQIYVNPYNRDTGAPEAWSDPL
jgi:hypothetical protein